MKACLKVQCHGTNFLDRYCWKRRDIFVKKGTTIETNMEAGHNT